MDLKIASSALSVQRAIRATGRELEAIRNATPRSGFPHQKLLNSLPSSSVLCELVDTYVADVVKTPTSHTLKTLSLTAGVLGTLHRSAQRIRSAVEWSSEFATIDWWIARRLKEYDLEQRMILVAPSRLGTYRIEPTSEFRMSVVALAEQAPVLATQNSDLSKHLQENVDLLTDLHLLQVPSTEGTSPAWRPLVLGHEIAHLKFTQAWIRSWLGGVDPAHHGDLVREAIEVAGRNENGVRWHRQLTKWLTEVACDFAAEHFYGPEAHVTLESHLAAYSVPYATDSHPSPEIRLAILRCSDGTDLDSLRPSVVFDSREKSALDALLTLAPLLRISVVDELEESVSLDVNEVEKAATAAQTALADGEIPSSHSWGSTDIELRASSLESGLVRGFWRRRQSLFAENELGNSEVLRDEGMLGQALDALEFSARFDQHVNLSVRDEFPERATPNVLWLSKDGVRSAPNEESGEPSHDLRLGRHFIVFQRNAVSDLSSLGEPDPRPAPVQRSVEVGWGDEFILHPHELVLATTHEEVRVSNQCVAQVLSRSSMGRLGLLSATAVHIQPGFVGCLTLELVNLASVPLRLTPGQRIAQVVPAEALGETPGYDGAYQNQRGRPQFSLAQKDWDTEILRAMRPPRPPPP